MTQKTRGQVLVLFALMLVVLLGFAALAIDVTGVLSEQRTERTIADAAALAGASDTYRNGSTVVGAPEYRNARTHAMQNLMDELSPTFVAGDPTLGILPTCAGNAPPYTSDIVNCPIPGSQFYVSIKAPAPSCASGGCDPVRSVQVTVRNPRHGLAFARLFGQEEWNLAVTSVAERNRGTNYSFVTLRPPKPSRRNDPYCAPNCDANEDDILLDGTNTELSVLGDMGTNTNMTLTAGATVVLQDPGSFVDRYDAYQNWSAPPPGRQIPLPVPDPNYPIPATPTDTSLIYRHSPDGDLLATDCTTLIANIPATYSVNSSGVATGEVVCLKPGRYTYTPGNGAEFSSVRTIILAPGVYFFDAGFMPGNTARVIGGYQAGMPGVALVFQEPCNAGCAFAGNAVPLLALNAGTAYPDGNSGTPATAAQNWDGTFVETTGRVPLPMTLIVQKDPVCVVGPTEPDACARNKNKDAQLNLPGGGSIFVFGVQYAATDNVQITGGSAGNGFLGQIWAWTVQYTGGSNINLIGAQNPEPGVLRIATPCSPAAACTNPEATAILP